MEAIADETIVESIVHKAVMEAIVEAIADKAIVKAIVDEAIMETMEVVSVAIPCVTRQYADTNCCCSHQNESHCAGNFLVIFHCLILQFVLFILGTRDSRKL